MRVRTLTCKTTEISHSAGELKVFTLHMTFGTVLAIGGVFLYSQSRLQKQSSNGDDTVIDSVASEVPNDKTRKDLRPILPQYSSEGGKVMPTLFPDTVLQKGNKLFGEETKDKELIQAYGRDIRW